MSTILTETSTFTATVTAPDDGDSITGASVTTGLQSLTNRTKYLNDAVTAVEADVAALPTLAAGSWAPTFTAGSGTTGTATLVCAQYQRVGDIVYFSANFYITKAADGGGENRHIVSFTLPVDPVSNFADTTKAAGVVSARLIGLGSEQDSVAGWLYADSGAKKIQALIKQTGTTDDLMFFCTGSYTLA